jgi:predicted PurR-regulated permease PerM
MTWLVLGLIDSFLAMSERLNLSTLTLPSPPETVKGWPIIGDAVYQYWVLASTNLRAALVKIAPQLKPLAATLFQVTAGAGIGAIKFFAAVLVAGFLFPFAPSLVVAIAAFSRKLDPTRGEKFIHLAGATIRAVSRGIIGISMLQACLAGIGLAVAGVPGTSLITSAVLVLGIVQIGPSIILIPVIVWSWMSMEATSALLFTAYMVPVNLLDNILRPVVIGRGLETPMIVILLGVLGGTVSYGITGLFLGPIVLAVIWELLSVWIQDQAIDS